MFLSLTIGLDNAWLPSRRSVDSHLGGLVIFLEGQVLSGREGPLKAEYLSDARFNLGVVNTISTKLRDLSATARIRTLASWRSRFSIQARTKSRMDVQNGKANG